MLTPSTAAAALPSAGWALVPSWMSPAGWKSPALCAGCEPPTSTYLWVNWVRPRANRAVVVEVWNKPRGSENWTFVQNWEKEWRDGGRSGWKLSAGEIWWQETYQVNSSLVWNHPVVIWNIYQERAIRMCACHKRMFPCTPQPRWVNKSDLHCFSLNHNSQSQKYGHIPEVWSTYHKWTDWVSQLHETPAILRVSSLGILGEAQSEPGLERAVQCCCR